MLLTNYIDIILYYHHYNSILYQVSRDVINTWAVTSWRRADNVSHYVMKSRCLMLGRKAHQRILVGGIMNKRRQLDSSLHEQVSQEVINRAIIKSRPHEPMCWCHVSHAARKNSSPRHGMLNISWAIAEQGVVTSWKGAEYVRKNGPRESWRHEEQTTWGWGWYHKGEHAMRIVTL